IPYRRLLGKREIQYSGVVRIGHRERTIAAIDTGPVRGRGTAYDPIILESTVGDIVRGLVDPDRIKFRNGNVERSTIKIASTIGRIIYAAIAANIYFRRIGRRKLGIMMIDVDFCMLVPGLAAIVCFPEWNPTNEHMREVGRIDTNICVIPSLGWCSRTFVKGLKTAAGTIGPGLAAIVRDLNTAKIVLSIAAGTVHIEDYDILGIRRIDIKADADIIGRLPWQVL